MTTTQPVAARAITLHHAVKSLVVRLGLLLLVISLTSAVALEVSG
jgi:hypothetical protein